MVVTDPVGYGSPAAAPFPVPVAFVPDPEHRRAEVRSYRSLVRVVRTGVPQPPPTLGASVLLVPGFISGSVSLRVLARSLRLAGHRTFAGGVGANLGCTDDMVERVLRQAELVAAAEGRPITLVGHSRGGMIVDLAARRRPDLVAGVVVLAAPVTGTLSTAAHVWQQLEMLFRLHRRGFRRVISADCVTGECAARVVAELESPFPSGVPYTSIYSRTDAIIDWHTCLAPGAEHVEVAAGHTAMATDPEVARIVADRLHALA